MDKLQPILKQWFWILFGVVVILVAVGWFMGTSTQAKHIDERTAKIEGLSVTPGATTPNDRWTTALSEVRENRQERLDVASDTLWEQQRQYMQWPAPMEPFVEDKLFGEEFSSTDPLNTYRRVYDGEVYDLHAIVEPLVQNPRTGAVTGKILMPISALPVQSAKTMWPTVAPKSKEVWYLQEDLWLLAGLLGAVADLNATKGADATISKVPIKSVESIILKGGNRSMLPGADGAAAGGMGMAGGGMGMDPAMGMAGGGGMGMDPAMGMGGGMGPGGEMGGMGGSGLGAELDFELAEEVGPVTPVAPEGGDAGAMAGGMGMDPAMGMAGGGGMGMDPAMGMGMMGAGKGNPLLTMKRYVDEGADLPYKTRAFKMTVIMDHRKIPEFLVELTDSPFPVTILRVNWAMKNPNPRYDQAGPTARTGGGMMEGGAMGGMGSPAGGGFNDNSLGGTGGIGMGGGMGMGGGFGGAGMPGGGFGGGMESGMGMPSFGPLAGGMGGAPGMMPGGMDMGMGMGGMPGEGLGPSVVGPNLAGSRGPTGVAEAKMAMLDPYLATVVVGGLMTIYRDPAEVNMTVEEAAAAGADATTGAAAGDSADATAAGAAPGMTAPETGATAPGTATPGGAAGEAAPGTAAPASGTPTTNPMAPGGAASGTNAAPADAGGAGGMPPAANPPETQQGTQPVPGSPPDAAGTNSPATPEMTPAAEGAADAATTPMGEPGA